MPGGEEWWKQKGTSVETPPSGAPYEASRALKRIELHNTVGISMALAVARHSALDRCQRSVRLSRSRTC